MASSPYRYVKRANHPLRPPGGNKRIPEHRVVLYDKIGPGPHPCHWCGKVVNWNPGGKTSSGSLIADHIDKNQRNNAPENLVPSCQGCNIRRGKGEHLDTGPVVMYQGKRAAAVERVCLRCEKPFLIRKAEFEMGPNRGRYCSLACLHARNRP